jgi:hypothetical protein
MTFQLPTTPASASSWWRRFAAPARCRSVTVEGHERDRRGAHRAS